MTRFPWNRLLCLLCLFVLSGTSGFCANKKKKNPKAGKTLDQALKETDPVDGLNLLTEALKSTSVDDKAVEKVVEISDRKGWFIRTAQILSHPEITQGRAVARNRSPHEPGVLLSGGADR